MNAFGLGLPELLVIGVLALIFIGPARLPGVIQALRPRVVRQQPSMLMAGLIGLLMLLYLQAVVR
jgi:hypothetical protein